MGIQFITVWPPGNNSVKNMRAFILLAVLPLALANTGSFVKISGHGTNYAYNHGDVHFEHPAPAIAHPAPAPYKLAPTYAPKPAPTYAPKPVAPVYHPKPAPVYHPKPAPVYHHAAPHYGGYGYEHPKQNCSVVTVTEPAETCVPQIETVCEDRDLPIKVIVDVEQCNDITRTVCSVSTTVIPQEVCVYKYEKKYEETTAKTVTVAFEKQTNVQMVTVCQPHHGYGHHGYGGHRGYGGYSGYGGYGKYCKEVAQETAYNVPVVTPVDVPVKVSYPSPLITCVNKPIALPVVSCEDIVESKCITVPTVEDSSVTVAHCKAQLAAPLCETRDLALPKQVCVELVYGHAAPTYPSGHH